MTTTNLKTDKTVSDYESKTIYRVIKSVLVSKGLKPKSNVSNKRKKGFKLVAGHYVSTEALKMMSESFINYTASGAKSENQGEIEQLEANLHQLAIRLGIGQIPTPFSRYAVMTGCKNSSKAQISVQYTNQREYFDEIVTFTKLIEISRKFDILSTKMVSHDELAIVYGEQFFLCHECINETNFTFNDANVNFSAFKGVIPSIQANLEGYVLLRLVETLNNKTINAIGNKLNSMGVLSIRSLFDKTNMFFYARTTTENKDNYDSFNPLRVGVRESRGKNFAGGHYFMELNGLTTNYLKVTVDQIFSSKKTIDEKFEDIKELIVTTIPLFIQTALEKLNNVESSF